MELLLDTNFLISCAKFRIDFFIALERVEEEVGIIEVFIPMFCVREMQTIMHDVKEAKLALEMLNNNKITVLDIEQHGKVDDSLLEYAIEKKYAIATNDKELIRKAKENGLKVVRIRQMRYFEIE